MRDPSFWSIYREDHRFLLEPIMPRPGGTVADYDLIIASQPYRARASVEFKATRVIAPLARALGPGGRLIGIHSCGKDPGLEIIQRVWPDENPFQTDRHQILKAVKDRARRGGRHLNFNAYADEALASSGTTCTRCPSKSPRPRSAPRRCSPHGTPRSTSRRSRIHRLAEVMADGRYLDATRAVLRERGGLWFFDKSYVISRRRA